MIWPLARYIVQDASMRPTLRPGDRLLVWQWQWLWLGRPRRGDLVVVRHPEQSGLHLVKRVAAVHGEPYPGISGLDGLVLLGDEPASSRDSRAFGRVPSRLVVGCVVFRYLPGTRRGPIGGKLG